MKDHFLIIHQRGIYNPVLPSLDGPYELPIAEEIASKFLKEKGLESAITARSLPSQLSWPSERPPSLEGF